MRVLGRAAIAFALIVGVAVAARAAEGGSEYSSPGDAPAVEGAVVQPDEARAAAPAYVLALYAGRLLTVDEDTTGALTRGDDLYALRLIVAVPGPYGLRVGFRGDLTSLSYIDPSSLEVSGLRTAEGYGALSWSARIGGVDMGPALMAGALVPIQDAVSWRIKSAWGGGARFGYGRSWAYALAGRDAAADGDAYVSQMRFIGAASIEVWRISLQGEWVSGPGGRKRAAAMVRIPLPTWGAE